MDEAAGVVVLLIVGYFLGVISAMMLVNGGIADDCEKYGQHVQGEWRMTCVKEIKK